MKTDADWRAYLQREGEIASRISYYAQRRSPRSLNIAAARRAAAAEGWRLSVSSPEPGLLHLFFERRTKKASPLRPGEQRNLRALLREAREAAREWKRSVFYLERAIKRLEKKLG